MKNLIDRDVYRRNLCEYCNRYNPDEPCEPADCLPIMVLNMQRTVDMEAVRCNKYKDCVADNVTDFSIRRIGDDGS